MKYKKYLTEKGTDAETIIARGLTRLEKTIGNH